MKVYIKNMVCNRCKMVVKSTFEQFGLHPLRVDLGEVEIEEDSMSYVRQELQSTLEEHGFELLDDKKSRIIERIKTSIIDLVHHGENELLIPLSTYLTQEIHQDYSALSHLFSDQEGITIEKYYILQKIEKVKELLVYDELTLSEIAFKLHYSSAAYLSNQFKKVTGTTPSQFKKSMQKRDGGGTFQRIPLEEI